LKPLIRTSLTPVVFVIYHFQCEKDFDATKGYPGEGPPKLRTLFRHNEGDTSDSTDEVIDLTQDPPTRVYFIKKVTHDLIHLTTIGGEDVKIPILKHETKQPRVPGTAA